MKNLTRYGTYGFLSLLLAAQMEMVPETKKPAKAVKRVVKPAQMPKAA